MAKFDDSTGKQKAVDARGRTASLSLVLILGICLGIVVSEKLYLRNEEAKVTSAALTSLRSQKLEVGGSRRVVATDQKDVHAGGSSDASPLFTRGTEPRNDLERLLQKVAPDGEVMIVISNMNLIREDSLRLWLDGAKRIPSKNWLVVAIDEELRDYCQENGISHYYRPVKVRKRERKNVIFCVFREDRLPF